MSALCVCQGRKEDEKEVRGSERRTQTAQTEVRARALRSLFLMFVLRIIAPNNTTSARTFAFAAVL
jgi:hypothetical protein